MQTLTADRNAGKVSGNLRIPVATIRSRLSDYSGNPFEPFIYCATDVPPPQPAFTAGCQQESSLGWAYASNNRQVCTRIQTTST